MYIGRSITTDKTWKVKKYRIMTQVILLKSAKSKVYRDYLASSTNSVLVEDTTHQYWGRGKDNTGKNILGMIHAEIREGILNKTV